MLEKKSKSQGGSRRNLWGWFGTLTWLSLATIYILVFAKEQELASLKPNEVGDLAAGIAAPLAFWWLVLGYYQQGEELRLSNEALKKQSEETERLATEAVIQAKAISMNEVHSRQATFLRLSEYLLNGLNARAVEMAGLIYNKNVIEKFWREYNAGDKDVFFKVLLSRLVQGHHVSFLESIDRFVGGRQYVHIYCNDFEILLGKTKEVDMDGVLTNYFASSNSGQLYWMLCRLVERKSECDFTSPKEMVY